MKTLEKVNYKGFIWPLAVGIVLWLITPWRPGGLSVCYFRCYDCWMYHKAFTDWWYHFTRNGSYGISWSCSRKGCS